MHFAYFPSIANNQLNLNEEESKHVVKVLRKVEGDRITILDGKGSKYLVEITVAHPKKCGFKIIDTQTEKPVSPKVHIAIAPTKNNDRLEWFLEKATEIGITEITPIACEHSERKTTKHERLEKVIISAMKQSQQFYLPKLNTQIKFTAFIQQFNNTSSQQLFIAHCEDGIKKQLKTVYKKAQDVTILIGPEGDFSPNEISVALKNNFVPVSLGESRLRTETAGVVACHTIQLLN